MVAACVLVLGLISAVGIYLNTPPDPINPLELNSLSLKRSTHQLKVLGGGAALVSEEFQQWFVNLWHGRNLAYTVGTLAAAGFVFGWYGFPFLHSLYEADRDRPKKR